MGMLCISGSDNKSDAEQGETRDCADDEFPTYNTSTTKVVMTKIEPHARGMRIQLLKMSFLDIILISRRALDSFET